MSKTYIVHAKRWERGWELDINGIGVTQSRSLRTAKAVAREYISLAEGIEDESTIEVQIRPVIGAALSDEIAKARQAVADAAQQQQAAAALSRIAVKDLVATGLSGQDIAVVLDVSPQRVSQLLHA